VRRLALVLALGLTSCEACGPQGPQFSVLAEDIPGGALLGAHADGDEVIFVGGDVDGSRGVIARYSAGTLCLEADRPSRTLWWIHGIRDGEWYAVGDQGLILHEVDGERIDESVPTSATLYGVFESEERVFAVGGDVFDTGLGEIWVREDGAWSLFQGDIGRVIFKVWETWFVGEGVAFFLEGDELVDRTPPDDTKLLTVVGRDLEDVFAVGGNAEPTLLHWEGDEWAFVDFDRRCSLQPLNGVWTAPGEDVYVAGFFGAMARFDGEAWECPLEPVASDDFHVAYKVGDEVFFGGGNLFTQNGNRGIVGRYGEGAAEPLAVTDCP
jgi:hypothetical protein